MAPRRAAIERDAAQIVIASDLLWAHNRLRGQNRAQRHHLVLVVADVDAVDVVDLVAVVGARLEDDLPDPSVDVELIDEEAAEGGPERLEDVAHSDAEDLRPVAVDVEIDLRRRGIERAEHGGQL